MRLRKLRLEELTKEVLKINEALKPLNIKIRSDYSVFANQRLDKTEVNSVKLEIQFYEED